MQSSSPQPEEPKDRIAVKRHAKALFLLTVRDIYFAVNYFLLAVLKPIDEQGNARESYLDLGLEIIAVSQGLNLIFEFIKYKKILSVSREMQLERIIRHSINGVKQIAILFAYLNLFSDQLTDNKAIKDTAHWLDDANPWLKLPIVAAPAAVKAYIGWYLNKREFNEVIQQPEAGLLIPKPLHFRKFNPRYNVPRLVLLLPSLYVEGAIFAAIDLSILEDFNVNITPSFAERYVWIKPTIQTLLFLLLLDHPVFPSEPLRRLGRFLHRFFTQAVQNTELSFAVILNLLSIRNESYTISNASALTLLVLCYELSTILSEAHFQVTAAFNDRQSLAEDITRTEKFIRHFAMAGLIASTWFPATYAAWLGVASLAVLTDTAKLITAPEKFSWQHRAVTLPKNITRALAIGSLLLLSIQDQTGEIAIPYNLSILLPTTLAALVLHYFRQRNKAVDILDKSLKAGLLGSTTIVALHALPGSLQLKFNNIGLEVAAFAVPALTVAAKEFWDYRRSNQYSIVPDQNPTPTTKKLSHTKLIANNLLALLGMIMAYCTAENNSLDSTVDFRGNEVNSSSIESNSNDAGDIFAGQLTSIILICFLAGITTYLNYRNKGWQGFSNPLTKFGICLPNNRQEKQMETRQEDAINIQDKTL